MIILHTLGTASIEIEGSITITTNAPNRLALLLYLAVERGREFSSEQLAGLLFPQKVGSDAGHSLREVLYQLRRAGAPVVHCRRGYTIESADVRSDCEAALRAPAIDEDTLRRMTGGFLPTFAPPPSDGYTDWLDALRGAQVSALLRRVVPQMEKAMSGARWDSAELAARACIGLDPWNERATFALAEILAVGGSKAAAFQLLDDYITEFGSQSELAQRAGATRRRIADGLTTTLAAGRGRSEATPGSPAAAPPRLIGREIELAALLDAFGRARAGDSQCIVVAGEAGIGKTRLVSDFSAAAVIRKAHVERVVIQPHDGDRPMGAFVDLVPALLEAPGALGCSPESMAALCNLTGKRAEGDIPPQATAAEEHEQRWSAVSRAVVDLCEAIANERTLVLVIEDAHWLDTLSANTIGRIVGTRRQARIVVIATTRDARALVRDIHLTERCQTLSLPPLAPDAAGELLDIILPATPATTRHDRVGESLPSIKTRIAGISAGNPLFLISLAAHSRAHRGPFEVPGTIVETFAQRIDALSYRAMSVLATCAELGKHSTMRRLVRSLEMRKHELVESLLELTGSGLVLEDEQSAVPAHPLVSEALRSRLPQPARRAVAHAVAATLEADASDGASPALWWDAAESWRVADNPERAINALRRCADHTLEIGRPGEAARILEHAAALPQTRENLCDLSAGLMKAAFAANEFRLVLRGAEFLRSVSFSQSHDDLEIAELQAFFAVHHSDEWAADRLPGCIRAEGATPTHRVEAAIILLKCADMAGRNDLRHIGVGEIAEADLAAVDSCLRFEFEILAASTQGDHRTVAAIARRLVRLFHEGYDAATMPLRYYQTAAVALQLGGCQAEAIAEYTRLYAMGERRASYRTRQFAAVQLSSIFWDAGNEQESDIWLQRALAIGVERPELANDFDLATGRMELEIFRGRFEQASALLDGKSGLAVQTNEIGRRWVQSAQLGIRSGRGQLQRDSREVLLRIGFSRLNSMTGIRDFEVAVCVEALQHMGLPTDANAVVDEYLKNERRSARPPSRFLARAIRTTDPRGLGCDRPVAAIDGQSSHGGALKPEANPLHLA